MDFPNYILHILHLIAICFILENNAKIKGIISIPECHSYPKIPSFWVLQSDSIPTRAVYGLHYCLFIIRRDFGFSKKFAIFINECDFNDPIFFCHFDTPLPDHLLPIVKIVSLGGRQWRDFENGHSFCLVAEDKLRGLHMDQ